MFPTAFGFSSTCFFPTFFQSLFNLTVRGRFHARAVSTPSVCVRIRMHSLIENQEICKKKQLNKIQSQGRYQTSRALKKQLKLLTSREQTCSDSLEYEVKSPEKKIVSEKLEFSTAKANKHLVFFFRLLQIGVSKSRKARTFIYATKKI